MNVNQYSMPAGGQATTARAKETARRRRAYRAIDAVYYAGLITETARELAKWYVRCCCSVRTYHDLTQAVQAQQFGVSRRTIITLVQQLVAADLIWLEQHGTCNRTYLTAYEAPPDDAVEVDGVCCDPTAEEATPVYQQLRAAADAALAGGDTAQAAMYEYQAAMELARLSNGDVAAFFGAPNGDPQITNKVQTGSPSTVNRDSSIPTGDTESTVCAPNGDDGEAAPQRNEHHTPAIPDTEATRLLRACGVLSTVLLRKHATAPPELIRRAEARRAELGYDAGLIPRILDDGGVIWGRCGQGVGNSAPALREDDAGHAKYTGGALGRYITTGLEQRPATTEPTDDPELAKYRGRGLPGWGDDTGP